MDVTQLPQLFVSAVLGAAIVKLFDIGITRFNQRHARKAKQIESIMELLDDYADLASLYYRLARKDESLIQDENGNFVKNEAGDYEVKTSLFEVEPEVEEAFMSLYNVNIPQAIEQKKIEVISKINRKLDLVKEIDAGGNLRKEFTNLFWYTIRVPDSRLKDKDFDGFVDALGIASETRGRIRSTLEKYIRK